VSGATPAPDLLVGDIVRHAARATPTALAATLGDGEITFAELDARANQVARVLAARDVGIGDRVAWWGETSLDAMPIFNAVARVGAAFMPVNARLGADEAGDVLEYAKPSLLIADAPHAELASGWASTPLTHDELFAAADREAATDDDNPPGLTEHATHVVFFTSGSTGRPKGVVLSHRTSWLRSFQGNLTDHSGGTVCMFPLFHMSGWSMTLNAWQTRCAVHYATTPDAPTLLGTAERRRATRLYHIPAVWQRVLDADLSAYDLSTVRECDTGTSATPPELLEAIKGAFPGTVTRIYYGSTEVGLATMLADADIARKPGSVGPAAVGVSIELLDGPDGRDGRDGEVCVRSPFLMDGYFEHPDANGEALAPVIPGGPPWYHTGDLGVLDDEGYLSIVGRARDVLRTGGETVAPAEVEAVLATHPDVAEVAVVGLPDTEWGEVVTAVVVVREGDAVPSLDALRAHCDGRLARFKQPRRVATVDALPRTAATGQIQRTLLVERLISRP
jgi:acyl-CoA synthetase (AMP-forming)/AMP-acid ligase II